MAIHVSYLQIIYNLYVKHGIRFNPIAWPSRITVAQSSYVRVVMPALTVIGYSERPVLGSGVNAQRGAARSCGGRQCGGRGRASARSESPPAPTTTPGGADSWTAPPHSSRKKF